MMRWLAILGLSLLVGCSQGRQLMVEGNRAYVEGKLETAAGLYQQAAQDATTRPAALLNLGRVLVESKKFSEALEALDQGLEELPDNGLGLYYRAQAHLALNSPVKAETDLKKALQAAPNLGEGWLLQAKLLYAKEAHKEAFASLEQALRDPGVQAEAALLKAEWARGQGDLKLARVALQTLLQWRPYSGEAHLGLGELLQETDEPAAAEQHYRSAMDILGEDQRARMKLADLLLSRGRLAEAAQLYTQVSQSQSQLAAEAVSKLQELNSPSTRIVVITDPKVNSVDQPVARQLATLVGEDGLKIDKSVCPPGWDQGFLLAQLDMAFHVTEGTLTLESSHGKHSLGVGQSAFVPKGTPVGIRNEGKQNLTYLWVSVPRYRPELVTKLKALP